MNTRIRQLRKSLKLNQAEFSQRIGLSQASVCAYEKGHSTPSKATITAICRTYGVNEEWLRTGDGTMYPSLNGEETADGLQNLFFRFLNNNQDPLREKILRMLLLLDDDEWQMVSFTIQRLMAAGGSIEKVISPPENWSQRQARLLRQEADAIEQREGNAETWSQRQARLLRQEADAIEQREGNAETWSQRQARLLRQEADAIECREINHPTTF